MYTAHIFKICYCMVVLGNNKSYQMYWIVALGKYKVLFTITELLCWKKADKRKDKLTIWIEQGQQAYMNRILVALWAAAY
jgi:hypothetical protein